MKSTGTRSRPGRNSALLLLIIASVAGGVVARWCMSSAIGVSPDSVIYLSAADSLIAGDGLKPIAFHYSPKIAGDQPLVSFPPTYPLLLSFSELLSADRMNGVRWLHSLLFALNILLLGIAVYLSTNGSSLATLCAVLLFACSLGILEIHTMALSEGPFILFMLATFILLVLHFAKLDVRLLLAAAVMASLAMTTRYVGVTMLPPVIVTVLLVRNRDLRGRLKDCLIFLGVAIFPLAAWLLHNRMVAGSAANRSFAFHPMKFSDIRMLAKSFLTLWAPPPTNLYLKLALLLLGSALFLAGIVLALKRRRGQAKSMNANSAAQTFAKIFVITYLLFLYVYNSLTDPAVDLGTRILAPAFVFAIIWGSAVAHRLARLENRATIRWGFLVLMFILISVNVVRAVSFATQRHADGSGYTSREWAGSQSIKYLRTLPLDRSTYSNGIDAIHFLTGRKGLRIPARVDPTGGKTNAEFEQEINAMRNELIQNGAVVIYFNRARRWYLPSSDELEKIHKLPVLVRLDDGVVYGIR